MKKSLSSYLAIAVLAVGVFIDNPNSLAVEPLVLVADGKSVAPIVLFEDAPPLTRLAAEDLADYMEKITGARPELLEGRPEPLPEHAIWVGYQPVLEELFPGTDFDFEHPEEILIEANGNHLVIVGRDRWDVETMNIETARRTIEGVQQEYGTANAVYTFLQDFLEVRWFWPGEWGEDIIERDTIAFEPFVYRYHPQVRGRMGLFAYSTLFRGARDWMRYQRLQLDSLGDVGGGHGFGTWWNRFHEEHPDWFALQPDGTRSGFPKPGTVKMCMSNPEVWEQWIRDVEAELEANPNQKVFNASPNDGYNQGHCICANCLAWDHPEGQIVNLYWEGLTQEYVAMSDRQVKFANTLARLLKERYPDEDFYVQMMAYGASRPAPVGEELDDNVIVNAVFNFHNRPADGEYDHRGLFHEWAEKAPHISWRPNLGHGAELQRGMLNVGIANAMEDFPMVADHGVLGLFFDTLTEHWATQGPYYYIMGQLAWDPYADGEAIMADYYRRGFGDAAEEVEAYWRMIETAAQSILFEDANMMEVWDEEFFAQAHAQLDQAAAAVAGGPERFQQRIAFFRLGLDYTESLLEARRLMTRYDESGGEDTEAVEQARQIWLERIRPMVESEEFPHAFNAFHVRPGRWPFRGTYFPDDLRDQW